MLTALPADVIERASAQAGRQLGPSLDGYVHQAWCELSAVGDHLSEAQRMRARGSAHVGTANVFVSWSMITQMDSLLDALETWLAQRGRKAEDTFFWISSACIRQFPYAYRDADVTELGPLVATIKHTVLVLDPWDAPVALKRVWCLFEMYCTVRASVHFGVALTSAGRAALRSTLSHHASGYRSVIKAESTIDVREASSLSPLDRTWILEMIEAKIGCKELNRKVMQLIHAAFDDVVLGLLDEVSAEERLSTPLLYNVAGYLQDHGEYAKAEALYREDLAQKRLARGGTHADTVSAMVSLAQLLHENQGKGEAEELLRGALAAQRLSLGNLHTETLRAINNMALLVRNAGDYDQAEILAREAAAGRETTHGARAVDTLTSKGLLASVLRDKPTPDLTMAEKLYREVAGAQKDVLGPRHPHLLATLGNLSDVLRMMERIDEAREVLVGTVDIATEVLGTNHCITLTLEARDQRLAAMQPGGLAAGLDRLCAIVERLQEGLGDAHPQARKYAKVLELLSDTQTQAVSNRLISP